MTNLDVNTPEAIEDPYPTLRALREQQPVFWDANMNGWIVTRYGDVAATIDHPDISADRITPRDERARRRETPEMRVIREHLSRWAATNDPPVHTRLRGLIRVAFTPKRMAALEPVVDSIMCQILDELADAREFDFVEAVGVQLPIRVIATMMGVPYADIPQLRSFSDQLMVSSRRGSQLPAPVAASGITEMERYFADVVEQRRRSPGDTLTDALIAASGEDRLDPAELLSTLTMLLFGGFETTEHLLTNGLRALVLHPEQLARLRPYGVGSDVWPGAVNEMMRWHCPIFAIWRRARVDTVVGGRAIAANDNLYLSTMAANRDPDVFPDPDVFDPWRPNAARHLAFGRGMHYCVGAPLAMLEAKIAFPRILERWSEIEITEDGERIGNVIVHGPLRLRLAIEQAQLA